MRITLNLASRPFIELRPLYARLRLWMMLLVLAAVPLAFLLRVELRRAAAAQAEHNALTHNMQKLRQEQQNNQAQMRQPQNAAVLAQSEFLNQLYKRKGFSWTAVMMDLETVLPAGVQVTNLEPVTTPGGQVTIRLRVNGPRDRAVELVRNLEHSRRFLAVRLAGESAETTGSASQAMLQPVSESSSVNFDILAEYNPLPRDAAKAKADAPQAATDNATDKPAPPVKHSTAPAAKPALPAPPAKAGAR